MPLDVRANVDLIATLTGAAGLTATEAATPFRRSIALSDGAGAGQANRLYAARRTISASATDSLDLAGVLTDPLGATLTFARIKGLAVATPAANANNVNITRPASNGLALFLAAGDGIPVRPNGLFLWLAQDATGIAVTAGTGDLLDIVNGGGGSSVDYDIVVIGAAS